MQKTSALFAAITAMLYSFGALPEDPNTNKVTEIATRDRLAHVASPTESNLFLAEIRALCGIQRQTPVRLVKQCKGTTD